MFLRKEAKQPTEVAHMSLQSMLSKCCTLVFAGEPAENQGCSTEDVATDPDGSNSLADSLRKRMRTVLVH